MEMQTSFMQNFKYDIPAGIVVFFVAVPLCLGIAHASGAPLLSGLISGIVGGIIVGLISRSPLSVSGPTAGLTAITLSGIEELGSYEAFALAIIVAGIFQIILGYLRTGIISKYFPLCVINGTLAAIGLILIFKQLPHLLGYDVEVMGVEEFHLTHEDISDSASLIGIQENNTFDTMLHSLKKIHPIIAMTGISSLMLLFLWDLYIVPKLKFIPGSVFVVVISTVATLLYQNYGASDLTPDHFVSIPNISGWSSLMENTKRPAFEMITQSTIYIIGLRIALVASIETLLSLEAIDRLDSLKRKSSVNKELISQGIGNIFSGFLGGLPITSVLIRGSVNASAGARTQLSTITHGTLILAGLLFFNQYLNYIPLTGLAAILIYTGYKLASPKVFIKEYKSGFDQFIPSIVTVIAILVTDLLIGVVIGLIVSMLFIVAKTYQAPAFRIEDKGSTKYMVLAESVHFLHKYKFTKLLNDIPVNTIVEIDASKTLFMDSDIEQVLLEFTQNAADKNITVIFEGFKKDISLD